MPDIYTVDNSQLHVSPHLKDINVTNNYTWAKTHNDGKFFSTSSIEYKPIDYNSLAQNRFKLQFALAPRLAELNKLIPASFSFKTTEEKHALAEELKHTYYLITLQYALDKAVNNKPDDALLKCQRYIGYLTDTPYNQPASQSGEGSTAWYRFIALFGIVGVLPALHQDISSELEEDGYADGTIAVLTQYNSGRLYWVWGGGFIASALSCMTAPYPQFFNSTAAAKAIDAPSTVTGYISWILYYIRLAMNASQIGLHAVETPLMSEEEAQINWKRRANMQWKPRKYSVFNDLFWSKINLVCFAILKETEWLKYANGALTVVLLGLDVTLNICRFYGQSKDAQKKIAFYENEIEQLGKIYFDHPDIGKLKQIIKETKREWAFQKASLITDLTYSILLMGAFTLCVGLLIPPAAIPALAFSIMAVTGAFACFALGIAYEIANAAIALRKMHLVTQDLQTEFHDQLIAFTNCSDENKRQQLFLDLQHLKSQIDYQNSKFNIDLVKYIHNIALRMAIPFFLFAALVFAPTGVGLGVIAAAALLAFVSYRALCLLEPKNVVLPEFDAMHYAKCKDEPALIKHPEKKSMFSFFSRNSNAHGYQPLNTLAVPA